MAVFYHEFFDPEVTRLFNLCLPAGRSEVQAFIGYKKI